MRAVIIGNGIISDYGYIRSKIKDSDYIICADGGYKHSKKMDITPHALIGDFDSLESFDGDLNIMKYPKRKDFTDGELCMEHAIEKGADEIVLFGMSGTRLDHTINNILMLSRCEKACLIDEHNEIYILKNHLEFENKKGKTLSIIPLKGDMEGIVTEGLEYPLCDETLYFGYARGNSNVITVDKCSISIKKGIGIVVINDGE